MLSVVLGISVVTIVGALSYYDPLYAAAITIILISQLRLLAFIRELSTEDLNSSQVKAAKIWLPYIVCPFLGYFGNIKRSSCAPTTHTALVCGFEAIPTVMRTVPGIEIIGVSERFDALAGLTVKGIPILLSIKNFWEIVQKNWPECVYISAELPTDDIEYLHLQCTSLGICNVLVENPFPTTEESSALFS